MNFFFKKNNVPEITPKELHEKINNEENLFLLDVREPFEFEQMRLENTRLIPRGFLGAPIPPEYKSAFEALKKAQNKEVIVICRTGMRSLIAGEQLQRMGFDNVKSLKSGTMGWAGFGLPVKGSAPPVNSPFAGIFS